MTNTPSSAPSTQDLVLTAERRRYLTQALDYGLSALVGAEPFAPFVMSWRQTDGERLIERFRYGAYDDALEMALQAVHRQADALQGYSVVWDGFVDIDGQKCDAVIVELAAKTDDQALQIAQPYAQTPAGPQAQGEWRLIGETTNLLVEGITTATLTAHLLKPAYQTTGDLNEAIRDQPFAQMLAAGICLAANWFDGEEASRITVGIRTLQRLEQATTIDMSRRALRATIAAVAEGDLATMLPTDTVAGMMDLLVRGAEQLQQAVRKGLVLPQDAQGYLGELRQVVDAVLTREGADTTRPAGGEKLLALVDQLTASLTPA